MAINRGAGEATGRELHSKSMGSPAPAFAGLASFIFPVALVEEGTSTLQMTTVFLALMIFAGSTRYRQTIYQPA